MKMRLMVLLSLMTVLSVDVFAGRDGNCPRGSYKRCRDKNKTSPPNIRYRFQRSTCICLKLKNSACYTRQMKKTKCAKRVASNPVGPEHDCGKWAYKTRVDGASYCIRKCNKRTYVSSRARRHANTKTFYCTGKNHDNTKWVHGGKWGLPGAPCGYFYETKRCKEGYTKRSKPGSPIRKCCLRDSGWNGRPLR